MAETQPSKARRQLLIAGVVFLVLLAAAGWKALDSTREMERLTGAVAPLVAAPPARPPPPQPDAEPLVFGKLLLHKSPPQAPALDLPTVDGGRFDLASAKGQVVFVNFWATWCPPCRTEMPSMVKLGQELVARHPGKFKMVAVSVDESAELVKQFFKSPDQGGRLPARVTVALDAEAKRTVRPW
jgi:thiol-disulfide isomerase/thioredoxin